MNPTLRRSLITVPLILGAGILIGRLAGGGSGNPWFDSLTKPAIFPPPAAFGIAWTILYILMAVALAMILAAPPSPERRRAIGLFLLQLVLNLAWTPLFFAAHQMEAALWLLIVLDGVVIATIIAFARVRRIAAWLLAPYLAWILFATLLNYEFIRANA